MKPFDANRWITLPYRPALGQDCGEPFRANLEEAFRKFESDAVVLVEWIGDDEGSGGPGAAH